MRSYILRLQVTHGLLVVALAVLLTSCTGTMSSPTRGAIIVSETETGQVSLITDPGAQDGAILQCNKLQNGDGSEEKIRVFSCSGKTDGKESIPKTLFRTVTEVLRLIAGILI